MSLPRLGRPVRERTCYLHIGTHKTGTTSLQKSLAASERLLLEDGIYLPKSGRLPDQGSHHNLAWDLNGDERFDPRRGTFDQLLAEIAAVGAPAACLSSEDFEYLHDKPAALQRIVKDLRSVGYRTVVIIYLRPQASYAESLYGELVKHGYTNSFDDYLEALLRDGEIRFGPHWRFVFDYATLLDTFAEIFGFEQIVVRPYTNMMRSAALNADFFRVIGAARTATRLKLRHVERYNQSLSFTDVLQRYNCNVAAAGNVLITDRTHARDTFRRRFDPVHMPEVARIAQRFAQSNQRVYKRFGVNVPFVSRRDLFIDIAVALGFGRGSQARRRMLRRQQFTDKTAQVPA